MYEQSANPIPVPMLVVLVLWLTIIFISFGLFAPAQRYRDCQPLCVRPVGLLRDLTDAGNVQTVRGMIQISSVPLTTALAHLGQ